MDNAESLLQLPVTRFGHVEQFLVARRGRLDEVEVQAVAGD